MAGFNMGGLSDLSKKQVDMSFARSPANNQEINLSSMERKKKTPGVLTGPTAKEEEKAQTGTQTGQGVTGQTAAVATPFQGLSADLGSFNTRIAASVNAFLQGGASDLSAEMVGGFRPEYVNGQWVDGTGDQTMALGSGDLAGRKAEELGGLKEALSPYMVDGRFKKFEDVIEQFGDTNGDGTISPEEQANVNRAFYLVNQIRRLKSIAAGPEREALLMQLQQEDRDGLVTGIMEAMDTYEQLAGESGKGMGISGAGAKEFQLGDVLTMGTEDLAAEIENAAYGKDSLFGGTMAADLQRQADFSSERYRLAGKEQARVQNEIKKVADEWLTGYQEQLEEQRDTINENFLSAVQGIVEDLDKVAEAEGNPEWVQRAKDWFIETSQGSAENGDDFASVLLDMVNGEYGLQPEVRAIFEKYLDQTLGGDSGQSSLARSLSMLADKGYLEVETEGGGMKRVPLTLKDKLYISQTMANKNLTTMDKQEKIRSLIETRTGAYGADLKQNTRVIKDLIGSGELETATNLFRSSLVNSLKTYKDSFTDQLYQEAKETGAVPGQVAEAMQEQAGAFMEGITTQAETAVGELDKKEADATRDIEEINGLMAATQEQLKKGTAIIKQNYINAIQGAIPQYAAAVTQYLTAANMPFDEATVGRYAELYSYLRVLYNLKRHGAGPAGDIYNQIHGYFDGLPVGGQYLDNLVTNPTAIFKMSSFELDALKNSMVVPRFQQSFKTTEQYNQLTDLYGRLAGNLEAANQAVGDIHAARTDLGRLVANANQDLATFSQESANQIFDLAKQGQTVDLGDATGVTTADIDATHGSIQWVEDPHTGENIADVAGVAPGFSPDEDRVGIEEITKNIPEAEKEMRKAASGAMHSRSAQEVARDFSEKMGREFTSVYDPDQNRYVVTDTATGRKVSVNPNPYIDIVTSADDVQNVRNYVSGLERADDSNKNWMQKLGSTVRQWVMGERTPGPLESAYSDRIFGEARRKLDEGKFEDSFRGGAAYLSPQEIDAAMQAFTAPTSHRSSTPTPSPSQTAASPTGAQRGQVTRPATGPSQFISGESM